MLIFKQRFTIFKACWSINSFSSTSNFTILIMFHLNLIVLVLIKQLWIRFETVQSAQLHGHLLKGRVSTLDLLIKIGCFVKKRNIHFQYQKQLIWTSYFKELNRAYSSPSVRIPCIKLNTNCCYKLLAI